MNKQLVGIKGKKGAHFLDGIREVEITTEPGTAPAVQKIADVQYIGAPLPYSVPAEDIHPFTMEDREETGHTVAHLAQEAVTVYGLDPARVQRAAEIVLSSRTAVQIAKRDENGNPITNPNYKKLAVVGSKGGWYVVTRGACTCKDHANGHTCKHRIAAWMKKESIARPLAAARRVAVKTIMQELEA